jgi:hypothetical protein
LEEWKITSEYGGHGKKTTEESSVQNKRRTRWDSKIEIPNSDVRFQHDPRKRLHGLFKSGGNRCKRKIGDRIIIIHDLDEATFGNDDADEYTAVGAGLGGGFENTAELRPMKYNEALHGPDKKKWETALDEEHNRMLKFGVWEAGRRRDLKTASKIITSTWAMKKKASGTYRARINARGFEQREGQHYDGTSISAPVSNEMVIRIVLVLMIMVGWVGEIHDVQGAFLHGEFDQGEEIHTEVHQGFEKHYDLMYYVLLLLKTIYGLKQSAFQFWKAILLCCSSMGFVRSKADQCLYFKWSREGLVLWVSWIDDCLVMGLSSPTTPLYTNTPTSPL